MGGEEEEARTPVAQLAAAFRSQARPLPSAKPPRLPFAQPTISTRPPPPTEEEKENGREAVEEEVEAPVVPAWRRELELQRAAPTPARPLISPAPTSRNGEEDHGGEGEEEARVPVSQRAAAFRSQRRPLPSAKPPHSTPSHPVISPKTSSPKAEEHQAAAVEEEARVPVSQLAAAFRSQGRPLPGAQPPRLPLAQPAITPRPPSPEEVEERKEEEEETPTPAWRRELRRVAPAPPTVSVAPSAPRAQPKAWSRPVPKDEEEQEGEAAEETSTPVAQLAAALHSHPPQLSTEKLPRSSRAHPKISPRPPSPKEEEEESEDEEPEVAEKAPAPVLHRARRRAAPAPPPVPVPPRIPDPPKIPDRPDSTPAVEHRRVVPHIPKRAATMTQPPLPPRLTSSQGPALPARPTPTPDPTSYESPYDEDASPLTITFTSLSDVTSAPLSSHRPPPTRHHSHGAPSSKKGTPTWSEDKSGYAKEKAMGLVRNRRDCLNPPPDCFSRRPPPPTGEDYAGIPITYETLDEPTVLRSSNSNDLAKAMTTGRAFKHVPPAFPSHDVYLQDWEQLWEDIDETARIEMRMSAGISVATLPLMPIFGAGFAVSTLVERKLRAERVGPTCRMIEAYNVNFFRPRKLDVYAPFSFSLPLFPSLPSRSLTPPSARRPGISRRTTSASPARSHTPTRGRRWIRPCSGPRRRRPKRRSSARSARSRRVPASSVS